MTTAQRPTPDIDGDIPDLELIADVLRGNTARFEVLMRRYNRTHLPRRAGHRSQTRTRPRTSCSSHT